MIAKIINSTFRKVISKKDIQKNKKGLVNRNRSQRWVEALADEFQKEYARPKYRVFSKNNDDNRGSFRLNELLFDITVAKIDIVPSMNGRKMEFTSRCIWQVESEFKKNDSRETIIDFSKLILGASENKLLIVPKTEKMESWIKNRFTKAAKVCSGRLFVAFVPHPDDWKKPIDRIEVYSFKKKWILEKY